MILKIKEGNAWKFIENVKECTLAWELEEVNADESNNKEPELQQAIQGKMSGYEFHYVIGSEHLMIFLTDTTYLLNNEGKTIERLVL